MKKISPEEAILFLESFRLMISEKDKPPKMISIRIPENLLDAFKVKAKQENKKYQNLIVESMREYLSK